MAWIDLKRVAHGFKNDVDIQTYWIMHKIINTAWIMPILSPKIGLYMYKYMYMLLVRYTTTLHKSMNVRVHQDKNTTLL